MYCALYNDAENNKSNWCLNVKDLLYSLGMGHVWYFQTIGNKTTFLSEIKQRLSDVSLQNWHERLIDTKRGSYYLSIHDSLSFAGYLDKIKTAKYRVALCRIRTSSHRLKVETGRWARPQIVYHERKCDLCQVLDDEYHFVLECRHHAETRERYLPTYFTKNPSMFKFTQLISSDNSTQLNKLSKYIVNATEERALL